jgi:pilus assembly protein CpaC
VSPPNPAPMVRWWVTTAGAFLLATTVVAESKKSVEVQVEVTEVDHAKASSLGVEWINNVGISENSLGIVALGPFNRDVGLQANLHFLIEEGAAELLANPNLVTDSGTTATFHAGGEIPYIINASLGTTHVEFKPYGVILNVQPTVLKSGAIELRIRAAVSAPDETNGVVLSGNSVPALFEREVTSNVTVAPETTMTLAGMVQTRKEESTRGVPLLRHIPLIGALFRWKKYSFRRTSIIMLVTPKVVDLSI